MRFDELLDVVGDEPLFETGLLLAGDRNPADVRRQLSRWVRSGRLFQLRRGLYALAPPHQRVCPHPFLIANRLERGSYVSRQSAMGHYGLIPEAVYQVTSVGPGRPGSFETPLGSFDFRHLHRDLLRHYRWLEVGAGQRAFVASPEKALLDLVHLVPGADRPEYLRELRLQNLETLDPDVLRRIAAETAKPKLMRAAEVVLELREVELVEYEAL